MPYAQNDYVAIIDTVSSIVGIGALVRQHCASEQYVDLSKQYGVELARTVHASFLPYISSFAVQHFLYLRLKTVRS